MMALPSVGISDPLRESAAVTELARELETLLPGSVSRAAGLRGSYARDLWPRGLVLQRQGKMPPPPELVVWPRDESQVALVIEKARAYRVPIVPYGGGSGLVGGTWAVRGGVMLDLKRLERIGPIDPERRHVEVQAGVLGGTLERTVQRAGFTLGHALGSLRLSTVGGWLATRACGDLSGKYGGIDDLAVSVRGITGTAELLEAPVGRAGAPSLGRFLLGSEGTLCVFTGATLRCFPRPEHRAFRCLKVSSFSAGMELLQQLCQRGLQPSGSRLLEAAEAKLLLDKSATERSEVHKSGRAEQGGLRAEGLKLLLRGLLPTALRHPTAVQFALSHTGSSRLVWLFEGERQRAVLEETEALALAKRAGAVDEGPAPARAWFEHREDEPFVRMRMLEAGALVDSLDASVTWGQAMSVCERVRAAVGELALVTAQVTHAAREGCALTFHLLLDDANPEALERRHAEALRVALSALTSSGAGLSHRHGIGLARRGALADALGEGSRVLFAVKRTFDPDGVLNPGKLWQ